jgi:hypothetical protein
LLPLSDDFSDGLYTPYWGEGSQNDMQVAETGGVLRLTFPANPTKIGYAGIYSLLDDYDLTACSVMARVVEVPNPNTDGYLHFAVNAGNGNAFEFHIGGGGVGAQLWQAGVGTDLAIDAFSFGKHSWLRLSELAGKLIWEVSGDGKSWQLFASVNAPFAVTAVRINIGGGMFKVEASSPGTAAIDDVNLPPP